MAIWRKLIRFVTEPMKAFATPFALLDGEFKRVANRVEGPLLDRTRLVAPRATKTANWVSDALKARLVSWIESRVGTLPSVPD